MKNKIQWSKIDPHEFEFLIADCFSKLGYSIIQTKLTVDGGVDVIADKFDEATRSWLRFIIQVKRRSSPVGVGKVRELNGVLDDFKAVKGILIVTGGFTKAAKDFERNHLERVTLWEENLIVELLKAANLIDSEGNLRKSSDPNLKLNRRNFVCMILRENRPNALNSKMIAETLNTRFRVTVPIAVIEKDLAELSESGDIIKLENNSYHTRILEAEVKDICSELVNEIPQWDFHFDESDLVDYILKNYKVPYTYIRRYMRDSLTEILNTLKRSGVLCQIGDRYFTEQGLENFRGIRLSKEEMRKNLLEFFDISNEDLEKPITSIIEINKAITFLDKKNPRKKIIAFKQALPFKCTTCGAFSFEICETIPLLVAPSSLKLEKIEIKMLHGTWPSFKPDDVTEILKCSSLYVERLGKLIRDYKIGQDKFSSVVFRVDSALLVIDLNLKEKSTIKEMIENIIHESNRFQSFLTDLNQQIRGHALPKPLHPFLLGEIVPAKEIKSTKK